MPLLDLGGIVWPARSGMGKDPAFFRGRRLRAPLQNDLGQGRIPPRPNEAIVAIHHGGNLHQADGSVTF